MMKKCKRTYITDLRVLANMINVESVADAF